MPNPRTVYNTSEIAHLWANQKVPEARNRQGNFYFNGDTIYSYGSHFPIARLVTRKGKQIVLMTVQTYSNSTAKHIHMTRMACRHLTVMAVPKPSASSREILAFYREECNRAISTARKYNRGVCVLDAVCRCEHMVTTFNAYAEMFSLRTRLSLPSDWKDLTVKGERCHAEHHARREEQMRLAKVEAERVAALARKKFEEILPEWEAGKFPTVNLPRTGVIYLRRRSRGSHKEDLVETSAGAVVTLSFVRSLWALIQTARKTLSPILNVEIDPSDTSSTIRTYRVDRIDPDGSVHAGCHHIAWEQVKRFAKQLGWYHEPEGKTAAIAA